MRVFCSAMFFSIALSASCQAAVIGFDYSLSGGEIDAAATFGGTFPSAPIPGPIVSEYRDAGVTFFGGVILSYEAFGGPTDSRTTDGAFLESAPNLLATSDFLPLADGTELGGVITASFEYPVSLASFSIRNGLQSGTFTVAVYDDGVLVDTDTIVLGDFLGPDQDGQLTVSAASFNEVRIQSSQPIGQKDFGIDGFQYVPLSISDSVHASFELAAISAQQSEPAQDIASSNFEELWTIVADENEDGEVSGEEAFFKVYEAVDLIILAAHFIMHGTVTLTGPLIVPCLPEYQLLLNCGQVDHDQVFYSVLDIFEFDIATTFPDAENPFQIGENAVISFFDQGYDVVGNVLVSDVWDDGARFNVRLVADVTPTPVPLPSSVGFLLLGILVALPFLRKQKTSRAC